MENKNNIDKNFYSKQYNYLSKNRDKILKKVDTVRPRNIDHLRKFHMQLITISLIILAAVLPLLTKEQSIFNIKILTYIGIGFISLTSIMTVLYLTFIIVREIRRIDKKRKFFSRTYGDELKRVIQYKRTGQPHQKYQEVYIKAGEDYIEEEKELDKLPKLTILYEPVSWFLSGLFIIGIILIGLSLLIN